MPLTAYLRGAGGPWAFAWIERSILFTHDCMLQPDWISAEVSEGLITTEGIYVVTALPECVERDASHHGSDGRWSDGRATRLEPLRQSQRCPRSVPPTGSRPRAKVRIYSLSYILPLRFGA